MRAVYKFTRGERELWDYPPGLWRREIAAFELSRLLGWPIVPPTIHRVDGPFGEGSLQQFVACDFTEHYFTLRDSGQHDTGLRRIAAFDLLMNNADRKGGHILLGTEGQLWAIDNGLSFGDGERLRTVMWDFAAEPLPLELLPDIETLTRPGALEPLCAWLAPDEVAAVAARARALLGDPTFPEPWSQRQYPWPLV